jgi:hypothetical protein
MVHVGLDLSRARLDVCLVDDAGELVANTAAPPDADGLRHLADRLRGHRVRGVIESMSRPGFGGGSQARMICPGERRTSRDGSATQVPRRASRTRCPAGL